MKLRSGTASGFGLLKWKHFERLLREDGQLLEGQSLRSVEIRKDGVEYTTKKTGKKESSL